MDIRAKIALWELILEEWSTSPLYWHSSTIQLILVQSHNKIVQISSNLRAQLIHCLVKRDTVRYWMDKKLIPTNITSTELDIWHYATENSPYLYSKIVNQVE